MNTESHILLKKLDEFIRKYYKNKLIKGLIYTFTFVFLFFISLILIEYYGNFNTTARAILFFGFLCVVLVTVVSYLLIPLLKLYKLGSFIDYEQASEIIGKHFDSVKDKLINTLQLIKESKVTNNDLIYHSVNQKINELKPIPFSNAVDLSKNKKYLKYAAVPLLLFLVILFINARIIKDGTKRIINYNEEFVPEAPFQFVLENENLDVIENEDFELKVKLTGDEIPNDVLLKIKDNTIKLRKNSKTEFSYTFKNIQEKKSFSLEAAGFSSKTYVIKPVIKPVIMGYTVEVTYPSHTKLSSLTLDNINEITVPQGTRLRWSFKTKNTTKVHFTEQGKLIPLQETSKNTFIANKSIRSTTKLTLNVGNEHLQNPDSVHFYISTSKDQSPSIFVEEQKDSLNENLSYFSGKIADDFGFSKLTFNYRKFDLNNHSEKGKFTAKSIDFNGAYNQANFYHILDLEIMKLQLGESMEYFFQVWDNDKVNGYKSSRTTTITVKAPTKEELDKQQEEKSESIKEKLEKNIHEAQNLQEQIKKMTESILNKKNMDWQDKKKMKDLLQKQKELTQQNKEIQKEAREKNQEEKRFNKENKELEKKQEKLEKLMEELNSEEMEKLYEKLEKMMEKIDKTKLQKSLEELNQENLDLKKEMERTLELFKQMEMDEKLDEFAKKMEELAKKQEELAEKEEENTAEEQEKLKEEFKKAEEKLKELKKKNEGLENKKDIEDLEQNKEQAKDEMKSGKENLEKKKKKEAKKNQKNAAQEMKEAAAKAKEMKSSSGSSTEENMEDLRYLLENLITLSFDQEDIMSQLKKTNTDDPNYVKLGQRQIKLKDDAKMVEDSLFALSKRVQEVKPFVNKEMNKINDGIKNSLANIGERQTRYALVNQQHTMTSINNLALMLDESLKQMQKQQAASQKPGSGNCNNPGGNNPKPGLLPSLKQAQGKAGEGLKKLRDKMSEKGKSAKGKKGGKKGKDGKSGENGKNSKELARMAAEQSMLRKAINELGQELNKDGSGLGNELKKIEKDLEKVEEDIINNKINQETIKRQQDILTRLLKSEKALREREFDEKRESKTIKIPKKSNPDKFLEYKRKKEKEIELLKTIPPALRPYYKNRVNDYFNQTN